MSPPNVIFIFSDQHRAQAMSHAGDPYVHTPYMDQIVLEGVRCMNAVSTVPVCTPARATLLTGQYPLKHGLFVNDVPLSTNVATIGDSFKESGYSTAYIGKWHIDGQGRTAYIPPERRRGFDFWRVLECTHDYHNSFYYGDDRHLKKWEGYDACAQTNCAVEYIKHREPDKPFALFLSWGPPHDPYQTAPEKYRCLYNTDQVRLRPNVPEDFGDVARKSLAGYYGHIYVCDLNGPWLLYDNDMDPYQTVNLCGRMEFNGIQQHLAGTLQNKLNKYGDEFLPGETYMKRWGYDLSAGGGSQSAFSGS